MTDEREVLDYQTVKAWFRQLWELEADIESVQVEIRRLKDSATQCTANLSGMPSGSGDGDKVGSCIANADAEEHTRQRLERELETMRAEAIHRIRHITGTKSSQLIQECLYRYYVKHQKQVVIANDLSLPNENRVSLYVREGCKYLATVWDTFSL